MYNDRFYYTKGFSSKKIPTELDAIVVGSGIGGLTTAALMAKSGKKVLVLEQHDQAGGCCHTFIEKGTTYQSTYFSFAKALTFHQLFIFSFSFNVFFYFQVKELLFILVVYCTCKQITAFRLCLVHVQ